MKLDARCQKIELILCDVDGVMTDGRLVFDNQAIETKRFHIRDGLGIKLWHRAGHRFGVLTGRSSHIVKVRAAELGIEIVRQGFEDKLSVYQQILQDGGWQAEQVAFIGDDLPDLPVLHRVGLAVAVADAVAEVRAAAHLITKTPGGLGAVRETVEIILKAKGRWQDLIRRYD
jgi:YrbI family 3-deoxy-D-manno-octulosonate 8-phosphate phosphatase